MLKHEDMTTAAACVLETLSPHDWVSVSDVSTLTGLSAPRCQLLLTQFCLAGLMESREDDTFFKRCP
ncbi:MarR family transcriptional regulator [Xenorhabdus littoralis]|uniref:MarR family transcriptional regulator n=1 Tax=Xenorhabdus littoralis TaxID=2582835 RepID=UPI0029E8297D|nr:helix-turn-helix domain-containing protein [Xenorhabdus sp. psl]MDX7992243.1 MarR family transcriptional regulator [Xenorhabdus sp. psl]